MQSLWDWMRSRGGGWSGMRRGFEVRAREMEKRVIREIKKAKDGGATGGSLGGANDASHIRTSKISDMSTHLWTTRYVPKTLKEISGIKGQVQKLRRWLRDW
ncbi:hypothetical protein EDD16DRAFT_204760 [Pisolithus croceorrhizus]|nr:hypothetical protein EDD16DRAFT_204760 [Pisolithus croceorrhizus]KAI6150152.1 hypothetical protein EDD17DRAFT_1639223 [Pisolithus thermaeus]